jgi:hypothetical protein
VPDRPYCQDPEANLRAAQQLYQWADYVDAGSFGLDESGGADAIALLVMLVQVVTTRQVDYASAHVTGEAMMMLVPEAVSGYLRSLGDGLLEACE